MSEDGLSGLNKLHNMIDRILLSKGASPNGYTNLRR